MKRIATTLLVIVTLMGTQSCSGMETSGSGEAGTITAVIVGGVLVGLVAGYATIDLFEGPTAYLEENRRDIRIAISRGAGPFVSDVASALEVPPTLYANVGHALRAQRELLGAHLAGAAPMTQDKVQAFSKDLNAALQRDAALRPFLKRAEERLRQRLATQT